MSNTKDINKLAVIGTGQMGHGVAQVSLNLCSTVLMKDISLDAVSQGMQAVYSNLDRLVEKKKVSRFQRDALYGRMVPCDDYSCFSNTDLVLEAVVEDLNVKKRIVKDVEENTGKDTIFASNTSALPITSIAEGSGRPENIIGMHYFSPVPMMPLLEIITTEKTADWVTESALNFGKKQGKKCIVVKDGPAFYTTRILVAMLNQVGFLVEEGVDLYTIDDAMRKFGFPVGPVTLLDEIGLDTAFHIADMLKPIWEKMGIKTTDAFKKMNDKGFLGRKAKTGFFRYDVPKKDNRREVNQDALKALGISGSTDLSAGEIQDRVALVMVNEAAKCLGEGIIAGPEDGDTGAMLGLGFPMEKGGPFKYIDAEGAGSITKTLAGLSEKFGPAYEPSPVLEKMAKNNNRFYS